MKFKALLLAIVAAPSLVLFSAEPPRPRNGEKLVVINDDGFSKFYSGVYRSAEDLRSRMHELADTQVAVFEWCIVAGSRVNFPSERHELIGEGLSEYPRRGDGLAAKTLQRLRAEGVDTLAVVAGACRDSGVACYASMRMNGDYAAAAWDGTIAPMFNSDFWAEHPEFRQTTATGKTLTKLSYAYPEVREFKLGILREALQREIDGINLDFHRHPPYFGQEPPMKEAFRERYGEDPAPSADPRWEPVRARFMTEFVRETRRLLDDAGKARGRRLGLSVRVDWEKHRTWGCDIETWLKEGWLDYLVIGQYGLGGYEFDIAPFVELARESGCAVLFGEECILDGHDTTAAEDKLIAAGKMKPAKRGSLSEEDLKQRARRWYGAGADGVHLFNLGAVGALKTIGSVEP